MRMREVEDVLIGDIESILITNVALGVDKVPPHILGLLTRGRGDVEVVVLPLSTLVLLSDVAIRNSNGIEWSPARGSNVKYKLELSLRRQ